MGNAPLDLKNARILVTNDDGIHAPGIKTLERIAKSLSKDVWVVAPVTPLLLAASRSEDPRHPPPAAPRSPASTCA